MFGCILISINFILCIYFVIRVRLLLYVSICTLYLSVSIDISVVSVINFL